VKVTHRRDVVQLYYHRDSWHRFFLRGKVETLTILDRADN
jgi:hypothetical protein